MGEKGKLAIKLAIGLLVVSVIAWNLDFLDRCVLADGREYRGTGLVISDDASVVADGRRLPFGDTVVTRDGGALSVKSKGLDAFTATSVVFSGRVEMVDRADGRRLDLDLANVRLRDAGTRPVRVVPEAETGFLSTLGRLKNAGGVTLLAFAFMALAYAASALRWSLLLKAQGLGVGFPQALRLTFIGLFFNNVMPGLTGGDVVKAVMIAKEHPNERARAVGTVIVDRIIGLIVLALIAIVVIAGDLDRYRDAALTVGAFLGAAVFGCVFFLSKRVRRAIGLDKLLKKLPMAGILEKLDEAFRMYRSQRGHVAVAFLLSVVCHVGNIGAIYAFGAAIGLDARAGIEGSVIAAYVATVPVALIVSSVPLLPGGWGVGEMAFAYFFRSVGVWNVDLSVALSVTQRAATLLMSLLGGWWFLTHRGDVNRALSEASDADARGVR